MKDPAFLFYPGDWTMGTILFNRRHKGAYMDLMMAQFSAGHLSMESIKDVLGDDYVMWETMLKLKFKVDSDGKFYNERLDNEINRRKKYSEGRRSNFAKKYEPHMGKHMEPRMDIHKEGHMEIEIENEIVNSKEEKEIVNLYNTIIDFFDERFRPKTDTEKYKWFDVLDKLVRIDKHKPQRIIEVIKWTREDEFWKTNFMSLLKLRKTNKEQIMYFDVFDTKLRATQNRTRKDPGPKMFTGYLIKKQENKANGER